MQSHNTLFIGSHSIAYLGQSLCISGDTTLCSLQEALSLVALLLSSEKYVMDELYNSEFIDVYFATVINIQIMRKRKRSDSVL